MNEEEYYKLRLLEAKRWLAHYFSVFIENHAKVVFYRDALKKVEKIKEPNEQDKQNKKVYESHIDNFKEKAESAQVQTEIFRSLIETYSKNKPVKL